MFECSSGTEKNKYQVSNCARLPLHHLYSKSVHRLHAMHTHQCIETGTAQQHPWCLDDHDHDLGFAYSRFFAIVNNCLCAVSTVVIVACQCMEKRVVVRFVFLLCIVCRFQDALKICATAQILFIHFAMSTFRISSENVPFFTLCLYIRMHLLLVLLLLLLLPQINAEQ